MTVILRIILVAVVLLAVDLYAFQAVRSAFKDSLSARWVYWILSGGMLLFLAVLLLRFDRSAGPQNLLFKYYMGLFVLFFVPKLILVLVLLSEDLIRIVVGAAMRLGGDTDSFLPARRKFVGQAGLLLAAVPFAGILHGIWRGRYNYRVIKKELFFEDLPAAFDGLRITQLSDLHSGSLDYAEKVQYGIDLINAQKSDLILFTGDLVNNRADEMEPWMERFEKLSAPLGKYSILGNHDYGDYVEWESEAAKEENMEKLYQVHRRLGFRLMRNDSVTIRKGQEQIRLVGVENWGQGFVQYGDLEKATEGIEAQDFSILMSHDPSHFDAVVKDFSKKMHLTLSGHTHGMQFGIEIPGWFRWSPVKYRYPKWAGLYEENNRLLYVNRGFGYLAFPGRVGIWPEITVFILRRKAPASNTA